jgi:hypothetical protein
MLATARDAGDPEASLRMIGTFARQLYEPCAKVLRFMRDSGDPDLISRYREIGGRHLQLLAGLGPQVEQTGRLRPGMSGKQAVDLVWAMAGPETMSSSFSTEAGRPTSSKHGWGRQWQT